MPDKKSLYLDYNATAPIYSEVIDLVSSVMKEVGNASSVHTPGRAARSHVESARERVASLVSVQSPQVIFTSGATEANNMVLKAFADKVVYVCATEHLSVLDAASGAHIIPVDQNGLINHDQFERQLSEGPAPDLISIMLVNNETGVIQDIAVLSRIAKKLYPSVHIHTDAVQAAGRIPINFQALQSDYMTLSAHKMGGPQGVGALIFSPGSDPVRMLLGGGQEKRQRAGTENVAGIAGFGLAAEMALEAIAQFTVLSEKRDMWEAALKALSPDLHIFGESAPRVGNTTALALAGLPAKTQIMGFDLTGIAVSSGSACSSGSVQSSHVGKAMGASEDVLQSAYRISAAPNITDEDIDYFIDTWSKIIKKRKS